ncbi:MAG: Imidazole glycerol phosphate synthase subunit HisH 1 [Deltaproteobacteria bacterium ADurb.Bin510]|jgi:glutamine amidotransferase|nr:MAG: Imidazole glycerol phosphate synthase subunit HisH 1 [Deltaproteobacteria bacterium ADurb.Bin510]
MIAIVDYRAGNLRSVERALASLGLACCITNSSEEILRAERVIFPGVGAAGAAMATILETGLDRAIKDYVASGRPFMGICLGTQIILEHSAEDDTECLGLFKGEVVRFAAGGLKIPHMGWNNIVPRRAHPLLEGLRPEHQFYFVHSYYPAPTDPADVVAVCNYGCEFAAVLGRDNVVATQFHPEKSGEPGLRLLKNFANWDGRP